MWYKYKNFKNFILKTLSKLIFQTNITRTRQTVHIEVVAEEITVVEVFGETFIKIALKKTVSKVVELIIDIIYYYCFPDKRSAIYAGNLDASQ